MRTLLILNILFLTACGSNQSSSFSTFDGSFAGSCINFFKETTTVSGLTLVKSVTGYTDATCTTHDIQVKAYNTLAIMGDGATPTEKQVQETVTKYGFIDYSPSAIEKVCNQTIVAGQEIDVTTCLNDLSALSWGDPSSPTPIHFALTAGATKALIGIESGKLCYGGATLDANGYSTAIDTSTCVNPQ